MRESWRTYLSFVLVGAIFILCQALSGGVPGNQAEWACPPIPATAATATRCAMRPPAGAASTLAGMPADRLRRAAAADAARAKPEPRRIETQTDSDANAAVAGRRHRGASTITTWRPSKRGSCSTLASLEVSSLTRLSSW